MLRKRYYTSCLLSSPATPCIPHPSTHRCCHIHLQPPPHATPSPLYQPTQHMSHHNHPPPAPYPLTTFCPPPPTPQPLMSTTTSPIARLCHNRARFSFNWRGPRASHSVWSSTRALLPCQRGPSCVACIATCIWRQFLQQWCSCRRNKVGWGVVQAMFATQRVYCMQSLYCTPNHTHTHHTQTPTKCVYMPLPPHHTKPCPIHYPLGHHPHPSSSSYPSSHPPPQLGGSKPSS